MVLARQHLVARLLAGRAGDPIAALAVAVMLAAVAQATALDVAEKLLRAGDLLLLAAAATGLLTHLQAGSAGASVTTLRADMPAWALQRLAACVTTRWGGHDTRQFVRGLSTGTVSQLRQRAGRARSLVADEVAVMVVTFEGLVAHFFALPAWRSAGTLFFLSLAIAKLETEGNALMSSMRIYR